MEEKKCKHCAMMIPKEAKICPHCRKKLGWTLPAKIVLGLIVLGVIGSFMGKSEPPAKNAAPRPVTPPVTTPVTPIQTTQPSSPATAQPKFTMVNWQWETGEHGNQYITGTIRNNTDKTYNYTQVSFNLYDKSNAQVGSTIANINHFEAGGTWKFKAVVINKDAVTAKFKDISAF